MQRRSVDRRSYQLHCNRTPTSDHLSRHRGAPRRTCQVILASIQLLHGEDRESPLAPRIQDNCQENGWRKAGDYCKKLSSAGDTNSNNSKATQTNGPCIMEYQADQHTAASSYKRVKGRSHPVEKRPNMRYDAGFAVPVLMS